MFAECFYLSKKKRVKFCKKIIDGVSSHTSHTNKIFIEKLFRKAYPIEYIWVYIKIEGQKLEPFHLKEIKKTKELKGKYQELICEEKKERIKNNEKKNTINKDPFIQHELVF